MLLSKHEAAARVLQDRSVLTLVASFQLGVPQIYHEILRTHLSSSPDFDSSTDWWASQLWHAVMLQCELPLVQRLFALKSQPEYADVRSVQAIDMDVCAVRCGRIDVLEWLETAPEACNMPREDELLYHATSVGKYDVAHWLLYNQPHACTRSLDFAMMDALRACEFELFKKMVVLWPDEVNVKTMERAAASGNMEIVLLLDGLGVGWPPRAMDIAASNNRLNVVQFLHSLGNTDCSARAMDGAANCGNLDIVRFLHDHRTEGCTTNALDHAATQGHLEIVKFLIDNRNEGCSEGAICGAARNGHFEILVLLHEAYGVKVVRDRSVISSAFHSGRIDIALYLRDVVRVRFDKRELNAAISSGEIELVKFLHHNQPRRSTDEAIALAGANGNVSIIDYLLDHRKEQVAQKVFDDAVRLNQVALVKRLHEKYGLKVSSMSHLPLWENGELFKYMYEVVGTPLPMLEMAALVGHLDVVKYIWEIEGGNLEAAIAFADSAKRVAVVEFLRAQTPVEDDGRKRLRKRARRETNRTRPY